VYVITSYITLSGEFVYPTDVAVCPVSGHVVVADPGNHRIQVFDEIFTHLFNIEKDGNGFDMKWPGRVVVNQSGEILVVDIQANTVSVFSQSGSFSRLVPGPWNGPRSLALDDDDNIYVCDGTAYTIKVLDRNGTILRTFSGKVIGPGDFNSWVYYMAVSKDHISVSAGGQLHQFTKSGSFIKQLVVDAVQDTRGLAVTGSENLVVVNYEAPIVVMREGKVIGHLGDCGKEPWQLNGPGAAATTKTGQIVVTNWNNNNILVFEYGENKASK
jgi:DNA-binding beta-propeller fold protein YncE